MQLRLPSRLMVIAGLLVTNVCMAGQLVAAGGTREPVGILYCPSNPDNATFRAEVSAITGEPVDYLDARFGTPTLEQMQEYRAVFTWVNYAYADKWVFGETLADYVDLGGHVILGQWSFAGFSSGSAEWARIIMPDYCPVTSTYWTSASYMGDGVGCQYQGVATLASNYVDQLNLVDGPCWGSGTWNTGKLVAAWRLDKGVTYVSGHTGGSFSTGDWAQLTANIVMCYGGPTSGACCDPYTTDCTDNVEPLDCSPPLQFFWQQSCAELDPPCGDPGCCCDDFASEIPFETLKIYCNGRHLSGVLGENCVTEAFTPPCGQYLPCEHSITMWDDWGDGWNGGRIDIYVNGVLVAAGVTLTSGSGPGYAYFEAATGDEITTVWTPGAWPQEASYCIHDVTGAELGCDGLGGADPTGITVTAYCNDLGACCDDETATCTDGVLRPLCPDNHRFLAGALCDPDPFWMQTGVACGDWAPAGMLYAPTHSDNPTFRAAVQAITGGPVDYFDARAGTPTVEQMQEYRAVFTWANYAYADTLAMSERLVNYVDLGGRVILGQFCSLAFPAGNIAGRIMSEEYCPIYVSSSYAFGSYTSDGTDCVLQGVGGFSSQFLELAYLRPGHRSDGTMSTGTLAVAWRPDRRVYYSPGNTGGSYGSGDWAHLTANIVLCVNRPGDLNCDGLVNAFDIDPFVLALVDPDAYAAEHPYCERVLADINGDGVVNAFDIDPFVQVLTGGVCR